MERVLFVVLTLLNSLGLSLNFCGSLYREINLGMAAQEVSNQTTNENDEVEISINPNYFFTNFSFQIGGWWKVYYEPSTFYIIDDIPPFLKITFNFTNNPVTFHLEVFSGKEYMALRKWPDTSFFYIPSMPHISFDMRFPYTSYLSFNLGNQRITLGRNKVKWGCWRYPVALSGKFPYLDNFSYFTKFKYLSYSFIIASINPVLSKDEWKVQSSIRPVNADPLSPYYEKSKNLVIHRLEFYPINSMKISVGELTMVGGKSLDLFSLDPLAILHNNFNEGYTNSMLDASFFWTFLKGWNCYFEIALDDIAIPLTERADIKPTAYGLTTGIVKTLDLFGNHGYIEMSYTKTSRWMYNTFLPYLKFNARYVFLSNYPVGSRAIVDYPLGFEYGPDAQMFSLYAKFSEDPELESEIALLIKGPATIETEYKSDVSRDTKTYIMYTLRISFKSSVNILLRIINDKYFIGGWWKISKAF